MKTGSLIASVCTVCVLAGCVTSKLQPVAYRASGVSQKLIEYKSGGYASRTRFVANGTCACYEEYQWKKGPTDGNGFVLDYQIQRIPTADEWRKFWLAVDGLELARWRPTYYQSDIPPNSHGERIIVTDSIRWSVTYSADQQRLKSEGEGAYPMANHPERIVGESLATKKERVAVQSLEAEFKELVALPSKY